MHLLFVTSLVPDGEPSSGYEIANQSIVDALRRNGAEVTSIGFNWTGKRNARDNGDIILGEVDVRSETASGAKKANWVAKAITGNLTVSSAKLRVVSEDDIRGAMANAAPFDGYVINGVTLAGAFKNLFRDKPFLFVAHNVEHVSALENAASANSAAKRFLFRREAGLLRDLELSLCARAACTFVLAPEDRGPLGVSAPGRSILMPLVVARAPRPEIPARAPKFDAGLIGTWTWQPNRVGLEWFVREIVPLLPSSFSVAVAGHIPSDFGEMPRQVTVLGRVADSREFIRSCAVVPLVSQAGTGVQLKTIETFEFGLPSIATSRSVRGIAGIPSNCTIVDDPLQFAAALTDMAGKVRAGTLADLNGLAFHTSQIRLQDRAVMDALANLTHSPDFETRRAA